MMAKYPLFIGYYQQLYVIWFDSQNFELKMHVNKRQACIQSTISQVCRFAELGSRDLVPLWTVARFRRIIQVPSK